MKRMSATSLALAAGLAATPALAWAPTAQVARQLIRGQAWSEVSASTEGAALIHAAIDIAAPPKTVWVVMNDCRVAPRLVTTLVSCKIVEADPQHRWEVKEQVTRGNVFVPTLRNVVRSDFQPYSLIRFRRAGGDLKIEEGEWRLEPLNRGAGTRLFYTNRVAANISAPAFLVREGMKRDTAKVMVNLRRESLAALK